MKILSLFDGISCARVALERAGIPVEFYCSAEIDKFALKVAFDRYPDNIWLGDVRSVNEKNVAGYWDWEIDLLIGGSPCQDLSAAKTHRQGLKGKRSGLFYEYVRVLREVQPKMFILENVASMHKDDRATISKELGIEPVMIDAALVSAQSRKRLFWVGKKDEWGKYQQVEIPQPENQGILLKDILVDGYAMDEKARTITASYHRGPNIGNLGTHRERTMVSLKPVYLYNRAPGNGMSTRVYSVTGKSVALKALGGGRWG